MCRGWGFLLSSGLLGRLLRLLGLDWVRVVSLLVREEGSGFVLGVHDVEQFARATQKDSQEARDQDEQDKQSNLGELTVMVSAQSEENIANRTSEHPIKMFLKCSQPRNHVNIKANRPALLLRHLLHVRTFKHLFFTFNHVVYHRVRNYVAVEVAFTKPLHDRVLVNLA